MSILLLVRETRSLPLLLAQAHLPHQRLDSEAVPETARRASSKLPTSNQGGNQAVHKVICEKAEELRYVKALLKIGMGLLTSFHFDILAQLANIPARITLYKLLSLSKSTKDALR